MDKVQFVLDVRQTLGRLVWYALGILLVCFRYIFGILQVYFWYTFDMRGAGLHTFGIL